MVIWVKNLKNISVFPLAEMDSRLKEIVLAKKTRSFSLRPPQLPSRLGEQRWLLRRDRRRSLSALRSNETDETKLYSWKKFTLIIPLWQTPLEVFMDVWTFAGIRETKQSERNFFSLHQFWINQPRKNTIHTRRYSPIIFIVHLKSWVFYYSAFSFGYDYEQGDYRVKQKTLKPNL